MNQEEDIVVYDLDLKDDELVRLLVKDKAEHDSHWKDKPFELEETDERNTKYFIGDQLDDDRLRPHNTPYKDNRLFTATRAVLSYVTSQVATPDVAPSRDGERFAELADNLKEALHQHGKDHLLAHKSKIAAKNLIVRKRGFLKLRYDPFHGPYGDIVVETVDPSDIIVDRWAKYGEEPSRIYQRIECTLEELIARFPEKEKDIKRVYEVQRGTRSQMSRRCVYYECWFTYFEKNEQKEGVCWFTETGPLILGKMSNPNFIETGFPEEDRTQNYFSMPIKPYVVFNYLNSGMSYIDETSLFDQALPQQDLLNKRGRQIWENADYANGRIIANKQIMSEDDAAAFLNKNPKTILLVDSENVDRDVKIVAQAFMPNYVVDTLYDARNEIDQIMGTPNIFRGQQQSDANTLGENILIKEQASVLQDDLARAVDEAMIVYYRKLLHMMKVYYTEDHWFRIKGDEGKYNFILLNEDTIDTDVFVTVEVGSTLPANKTQLRETALELARYGKIDTLSLYRDLGLPEAEKRAELLTKELNDASSYMTDVRDKLYSKEANTDVWIVIGGGEPEERDEYTVEYLEYLNQFVISNRFTRLDPQQQRAVMMFLQTIQEKVARTASLMGTQDNLAEEQAEMEQPEEEQQV